MHSIERVENLVRIALAPGIGCVTVNRLLRRFGTSEAILGASEDDLKQVSGVTRAHLEALREARRIDPRPELDRASEQNVRLISYDDPAFPAILLETFDPPFLLYVKGKLDRRDNLAVGIVGTRMASRYGRDQAERFAGGLALAGYTVVSGLARGIDTFAHRGALGAGGRTIAVVGCGLSHVYPPENRDLQAEICASGAVVSEFPLDLAPSRDTFPRRNRIIAGMSLGTLVIEAPTRSGALITAKQALELGREVFAVPGRIDQENACGCHNLIREGAVLVRNLEDILDDLPAAAGEAVSEIARAAADREEQPTDILVRAGILPPPVTAPAHNTDLEDDELLPQEPPKRGKKIAQSPTDATPQPVQTPPPGNKENLILQGLAGGEPVHIDELCAQLDLKISEVSATLLILELKGKVAQQPGKFFVLRKA